MWAVLAGGVTSTVVTLALLLAGAAAAGISPIPLLACAAGLFAAPRRPDPPKHDPGDGFFMRHVLSHVANIRLGKVFADLAGMEDILRESGLDWTVVRPPRLTGKPFTGTYRTAYGQNLRGGLSVPRRRRPLHAPHPRPARHDPPSHRNRQLAEGDGPFHQR